MTRSVAIVNTSNWKEEDYKVEYIDHGYGAEEVVSYIKPGEYSYLPGYKPIDVKITPVEEGTPQPFYDDDGKQITPDLTVEFS